MGMQLKDRLPNRALSGPELREISLKEFRELLQKDYALSPAVAYQMAAVTIEATFDLGIPHGLHILKSRTPRASVKSLTGERLLEGTVAEFDKMLIRDYAFQGSTAYKRSKLTFAVTFHLGGHYEPKPKDETLCELRGEAPLDPVPERSSVVALQREIVLENPNIDRINHDMPIIVQRATPPQPMIPENALAGEPPTIAVGAVGIENQEYRYDRNQFPAPAAAVDTDVSAKAAARLGVPMQTGLGPHA